MMLRAFLAILIFLNISFQALCADLMNIFVVPNQELIVIQWKNFNSENLEITLCNSEGKNIQKTSLNAGSTIAYFETQALYAGEYVVKVSNGKESFTQKITLEK